MSASALIKAVDAALVDLLGEGAAVGRDQADPVHRNVVHLPAGGGLEHAVVDVHGLAAARHLDQGAHRHVLVRGLQPQRLDLDFDVPVRAVGRAVGAHQQSPEFVHQALLLLRCGLTPAAPHREPRHALEIEVRGDLLLHQLRHLRLAARTQLPVLLDDLQHVVGHAADQLVGRLLGGDRGAVASAQQDDGGPSRTTPAGNGHETWSPRVSETGRRWSRRSLAGPLGSLAVQELADEFLQHHRRLRELQASARPSPSARRRPPRARCTARRAARR